MPYTYQQMISKRDEGLDYLLALNGQRVVFDDHHWIKFEVALVEPSPDRPHGIRYNLTFHAPTGERLLGFDNAHAVRVPKRGKYSGKVFTYDHSHRSIADKGTPYSFTTPYQLVADFWSEVERVRKARRKG